MVVCLRASPVADLRIVADMLFTHTVSMAKQMKKRSRNLESFLSNGRKEKGLTLLEVASALGLKSGQSVWDWENGKGSGIPADMLLRLTKIYGLSVDEAYEHLLSFHQEKLRVKLERRFKDAKVKISLGKARGV